MLQIFWNNEYDNHKTLNSSFESKDRISFILENFKLKDRLNNFDNKKNNQIDINFLNKINQIYLNLNFWNCEECSFQNGNNTNKCIICNTENKQNIKLISKIEGDTTCYSNLTFNCLVSNINTIYYTFEEQVKRKINGFILIRPPGHHSNVCCDNDKENFLGFCLINNISIGVYFLQKFFNIKRIAIVDWDVHHGNGTQEIFYERSDVLFIDLHRYDGIFFPRTGKEEEKGLSQGEGFTINIPLNKGSDEEVYLQKFNEIVIPSLKKFDPDWILISCGFDAHKEDPIGGMKLSSESYGKFYSLIKSLNKKITLFLEGGYNKEIILESIENIMEI